jgi:NAD(P)-dependent dehydrogenase (short-subunit alcohol dehydrogenase family)
MAELQAANGSQVLIAGRRQRDGEELAGRLGEGAAFIRCDVTLESDVARAVARVGSRCRRASPERGRLLADELIRRQGCCA